MNVADALVAEGEMVTKWVVVYEAIDGDGERYLSSASSDDVASWDALGMLRQASLEAEARVGE